MLYHDDQPATIVHHPTVLSPPIRDAFDHFIVVADDRKDIILGDGVNLHRFPGVLRNDDVVHVPLRGSIVTHQTNRPPGSTESTSPRRS